MQFVCNGPNIPDELLQAHEEGRVVFFCGAGISYPAGLPGFKGLVEKIYREIGEHQNKLEKDAIDKGQYDIALSLLEKRIVAQRHTVRRALARVLTPNESSSASTELHEALLVLATNRDKKLRLVTTNFDRLFHSAADRKGIPFQTYEAPRLPVPKASRWNGCVFLHGLLPSDYCEEDALNRLVFTSGDFGLAYITERWASRFVTELFRNYLVCFVGYSINDPVMRYMMDALAADRMLGESTLPAWAFADSPLEQVEDTKLSWSAKGVIPIIYHTENDNHSALYETLKMWAKTYRDGATGKEHIVVETAYLNPKLSTEQDNFVARMLWALSDKSGRPAKRFAELNPVPPLDWLEVFSKNFFEYNHLSLFGISPQKEINPEIKFSLLRRPAPNYLPPYMRLVSSFAEEVQLDDIMWHLMSWLNRHLNDPRLLLWIAEFGNKIHFSWAWTISNRLDELEKLEKENSESIKELQKNSPNAVPNPTMKKLWRMLLLGKGKSPRSRYSFYDWKTQVNKYGLDAIRRLEFREILAPRVSIEKDFSWYLFNDKKVPNEESSPKLRYELKLETGNIHEKITENPDEPWKQYLPQLLPEVQQLLLDGLDLMHELGKADDTYDDSNIHIPSITPHWQNRGLCDWVCLIELLRDAWIRTYETSQERAKEIARQWFEIPYLSFKRLAFFAASHEGVIPPSHWIEWLLANNRFWLWSAFAKRELCRLLVLQGKFLSPRELGPLEDAILQGLPRDLYKSDISQEEWNYIVDRAVWLRLAKLKASGAVLGEQASSRLENIISQNPDWKFSIHEKEEFFAWSSGTGSPDYEEYRRSADAPQTLPELVCWLRQAPVDEYDRDNWQNLCRSRVVLTWYALHLLAKEGNWNKIRWEQALYSWSNRNINDRIRNKIITSLLAMPEEVFAKCLHSTGCWASHVSNGISDYDQNLYLVCCRMKEMSKNKEDSTVSPGEDISFWRINHPVGAMTETVLNLWFATKPQVDSSLSDSYKEFFTEICDKSIDSFRAGRSTLASNIISLYQVDRKWTEAYLLPLFDWNNKEEAKSAWSGFLSISQIYHLILMPLKEHFLETAKHFDELGNDKERYAQLLTYAALGMPSGYTNEDFYKAFRTLPQQALEDCVRTLAIALEGASEQKEEYYENRVLAFWKHIWPKDKQYVNTQTTEHIARVIIASGKKFPSAFELLKDWLLSLEYPHHMIRDLDEKGYCSNYPKESLYFLDRIIDRQQWIHKEVTSCLEKIIQSDPKLISDEKYESLQHKLST